MDCGKSKSFGVIDDVSRHRGFWENSFLIAEVEENMLDIGIPELYIIGDWRYD